MRFYWMVVPSRNSKTRQGQPVEGSPLRNPPATLDTRDLTLKGDRLMSLRNLLTLAAIISFAFGVSFVLIPAPLTAQYNIALNPGGIFIGQLFGAALIGFGVLNWFARGVRDTLALQAILLANLIGDGVGFVMALVGQVTGVGGVNELGWSTVAIYLLLTLGFGFFQLMKPSAS